MMAPVVLLADDDQIVRTVVQNALRREGFLVLPASSGEEALDFLAQVANVDMLVTDLYMGAGMTGVDLAERVLQERSGMPVLVISAHLEREPVAHGKTLPYLEKPFSAATLVQRVRETLVPVSRAVV